MRIRSQLFIGISLLAVALLGAQAWLQRRQLDAVNQELSQVATTVGRYVIRTERGNASVHVRTTTTDGGGEDIQLAYSAPDGQLRALLEQLARERPDLPLDDALKAIEASAPQVVDPSDDSAKGDGHTHDSADTKGDGRAKDSADTEGDGRAKDSADTEGDGHAEDEHADDDAHRVGVWVSQERHRPETLQVVTHDIIGDDDLDEAFGVRIEAQHTDDGPKHMLLLKGLPGGDQRLPIGELGQPRDVEAAVSDSLLATGLVLLLGLVAAALFADRVSRPLRQLAQGAEALSTGQLGHHVDVRASGEVAELVAAFNHMSSRLAALEAERARWQAREHLAELGDVARGLAHTLRNPLHTLGLAVEELAEGPSASGPELVATVRAQIHRIDRWLRSFLALGAGEGAAAEPVDLRDLAVDVVLESANGGAPVELDAGDAPAFVNAVPAALSSALSDLVANAQQASPPGAAVQVQVRVKGDRVVLTIADRGPGLPEAVRDRLFSPHTTTKAAGSGMGLYLAHQLIEGGHGGTLRLSDREGGGTLAQVSLTALRSPT